MKEVNVMNAIRRVLCGFIGVGILLILSILVMIYGWGLEPQSWWWIIGIGSGGQLVAQIVIIIASDND